MTRNRPQPFEGSRMGCSWSFIICTIGSVSFAEPRIVTAGRRPHTERLRASLPSARAFIAAHSAARNASWAHAASILVYRTPIRLASRVSRSARFVVDEIEFVSFHVREG
jgi:hypothetical protein